MREKHPSYGQDTPETISEDNRALPWLAHKTLPAEKCFADKDVMNLKSFNGNAVCFLRNQTKENKLPFTYKIKEHKNKPPKLWNEAWETDRCCRCDRSGCKQKRLLITAQLLLVLLGDLPLKTSLSFIAVSEQTETVWSKEDEHLSHKEFLKDILDYCSFF